MRDHGLIDRRTLAFGRAIAARLASDPQLVGQGRANIARWLKTCAPGERSALLEWQTKLEEPLQNVLALLTSTDETATRLRQSNPFTNILSQSERNQILRRFEAEARARSER